jgi:hypothetical protein
MNKFHVDKIPCMKYKSIKLKNIEESLHIAWRHGSSGGAFASYV